MKNTFVNLTATALLLGAPLLPLAAQAQGSGLSSACKADAKKLCADAKPGGGRVLACLRTHESELQAECKAQLPMLQQCSADVKKLCGDAGPRKLKACMKENAAKLSASCGA